MESSESDKYSMPRGPNRDAHPFVYMKLFFGGNFEEVDNVVRYVGGRSTEKMFWNDKLSVDTIMPEIRRVVGLEGVNLRNFGVWFKHNGATLTNGRAKIITEDDVGLLLQTADFFRRVTVWVVEEANSDPKSVGQRNKYVSWTSFRKQNPCPGVQDPITTCFVVNTKVEPKNPPSKPLLEPTEIEQQQSHIIIKSPLRRTPKSHTQNTPSSQQSFLQNTGNYPIVPSPSKRISPRVKSIATKGKDKDKRRNKRKGETKPKSEQARSSKVEVGEYKWSEASDSGHSDLGFEFDPEEEDDLVGDIIDASQTIVSEPPVSQVKRHRKKSNGGKDEKDGFKKDKLLQLSIREHGGGVDDGSDIILQDEGGYDSEELRSLNGSDEEVDPYPTFNPDVDFKRKIVLTLGLKFTNVGVLRKALRLHAIENTYDYYLLHNSAARLTAHCRHKCGCKWDKQHGKIVKCTCSSDRKCPFKLYAVSLPREKTMQIKSLNLEHTCGHVDTNSKVTSEFLADKYLDYFREDHGDRLKKFIARVFSDMGVVIEYHKAWLARSRAKQYIYGDAGDQYKKVYEYAHAILTHNPGSTAIVSCVGGSDSPPIFQRMYVCLEACKKGFKDGCRPLIGVDGCHLRGAYLGIILTAVAKDGDNCIFPVAWAVVEVEDKQTWRWFLELLMLDIDHPLGTDLTVMSDRQKGLVDALDVVCPKAEVRFCVRHIWANFKLHFSGAAFKESFWKAARTSSWTKFNIEMEGIRFLSEDAYKYLVAIPPRYWSRHAFQSHSKSNMLLNNMCETFNNVIKEARAKPIISCLEWIRRYVMKRNATKWESVQGHNGRHMPFVQKVFSWVKEEAKHCRMVQSRLGEWEVEYKDDRFVVNMNNRTCSCYKWDLTGIPCIHAYSCILKKRGVPDDYVHQYYSKATYLKAYDPYIKTMPGMKQWEATKFPEPLPPPIKRLPGRPKLKKRKKEAGENEDKCNYVKQPKRQRCCGNCGQLGHYRNKCANPPAPAKQKGIGGRPQSSDPWTAAQRGRKEAKLAKKASDATYVSNPSTLEDVRGPKGKGKSIAQSNVTAKGKEKCKEKEKQTKSSKPKWKP